MSTPELNGFTSTQPDDADDFVELIGRLRQVDPEAWLRFVDEFRPRLVGMARCRLPSNWAADAEDVAQDALTKFLSRITAFEARSMAETLAYLSKLVNSIIRERFFRGRAATACRKTHSLEDAGCADEARQDNRHTDGPVESANRREQRELVVRALRELPDHYREIIELRDLEERLWGEIAAHKGESVAAVQTRYRRATDELRKILAGMLGDL